jgi:hypothetical protein
LTGGGLIGVSRSFGNDAYLKIDFEIVACTPFV